MKFFLKRKSFKRINDIESEIENVLNVIKAANIYTEPKEETINKIISFASEYLRKKNINNIVEESHFNLSSIIDFIKSRLNLKRVFVPATICIVLLITSIYFYKQNYFFRQRINYYSSLFYKNDATKKIETSRFVSENILDEKIESLANDIEIAQLDSIVEILLELEVNETSLEIYDLFESIKKGGEIIWWRQVEHI